MHLFCEQVLDQTPCTSTEHRTYGLCHSEDPRVFLSLQLIRQAISSDSQSKILFGFSPASRFVHRSANEGSDISVFRCTVGRACFDLAPVFAPSFIPILPCGACFRLEFWMTFDGDFFKLIYQGEP